MTLDSKNLRAGPSNWQLMAKSFGYDVQKKNANVNSTLQGECNFCNYLK